MMDLMEKGVDPVTVARELLAVDPDNAPAACVLGSKAAAGGDFAEAERLLWGALELQPLNPVIYGAMAKLSHSTHQPEAAAECFWIMALWAVAACDTVPEGFPETFDFVPGDVDIDLTDPDSYSAMAQVHEDDLAEDAIPAGLRERIWPYWLLKQLVRGVLEGLSAEALSEIQAESAVCVPVWRRVLRAWAHDPDETNHELLQLVVALLGEHAGPEVVEDLWELSVLRDQGIFLHAHWAIFRMGKRFPKETIEGIQALLPAAKPGQRCGMAEHLGLMAEAEGAVPALLELMNGFPQFAKEGDAAYLLVAVADALSEAGQAERVKELLVKYERLLSKEGRAWLRETMDSPEGFVPRLVDEEIPDLDITDICVGRALMEDQEEAEEEDEEDLDEEDDDSDDEEEFEQPQVTMPKPERNDPCWCGSGKKYKKCHLEADEKAGRPRVEDDDPYDEEREEAMNGLLATAGRVHKQRDMLEAAHQYFDSDVHEEAKMAKGSEEFFLWYLFAFRPESTGRTAVEEHLRKHGSTLGPGVRELLESWRDSRYGLFEVGTEQKRKVVELKDPYAGDGILVTDTVASVKLRAGDFVLARVADAHGYVAFIGEPLPVDRKVLPALQKFIDAEIRTTGQTPAEFVQANAHRMHRVLKQL